MTAYRAWLGLGGNIGEVPAAMAKALRQLHDVPGIEVAECSDVYRSPPWGLENQPWFHNCCAEIKTDLDPHDLLDHCQAAERAGNRERKLRWGPRTIDIDIIDIERDWESTERLVLPHPHAVERSFVLVPLADIVPDHVLAGETIEARASTSDQTGLEKLDFANDWWINRV